MVSYNFDIEDWRWCIENDFQIYLVPRHRNRYRIAIRRGGITTEGKDFKYVDGIKHESKEVIGNMEFKNASEASSYLPTLYKQIRKKYEQKEKNTRNE